MRALLIGVGVVVAAALVVVILWTTSIDLMLARAIEHYGTEALGTPVRVGSVTLSASEGRGTIEGLRVGQPEGFGAGDAITVQEITLDIDTSSLVNGDPYVVELVRVAMPRVFFVMKADRTNNLAVIQEHAVRAGAGDTEAPAPADPDAPASLVRIGRLEFEGGRVEADLSALGLGQANAALPPILQSDVGGPSGLPPAEIGGRIADRFIVHAASTIMTSTVGRRLDQLLDENAGEVRSMLDSLFPR